ncbi:hypothetical protein QR97_31155 [Streptomyces sp. PBH53]|nr:hypothetical protein QR97_31155 [Streptomyces sp. PBH53]
MQKGRPGGGAGEVAAARRDDVHDDAVGTQQDGVGPAGAQPGGERAVVAEAVHGDRVDTEVARRPLPGLA